MFTRPVQAYFRELFIDSFAEDWPAVSVDTGKLKLQYKASFLLYLSSYFKWRYYFDACGQALEKFLLKDWYDQEDCKEFARMKIYNWAQLYRRTSGSCRVIGAIAQRVLPEKSLGYYFCAAHSKPGKDASSRAGKLLHILDVPVSVHRALVSAQIYTMDQIIGYSDSELEQVLGSKAKHLPELDQELNHRGIYRSSTRKLLVCVPKDPVYDDLDRSVEELDLPRAKIKRLKNNGIEYIGNLVQLSDFELYKICRLQAKDRDRLGRQLKRCFCHPCTHTLGALFTFTHRTRTQPLRRGIRSIAFPGMVRHAMMHH